MPKHPFKIASAQSVVSVDVRDNGKTIRSLMREAASAGARLIQFPEAALSGYVKSQITDWKDVDWDILKDELAQTAREAARLQIWTVVGCNYRLSHPMRPQNCLYVISDRGEIVARYSKRLCSHSELTSWYTPGVNPVVFEVEGLKFGCAICIEVCFPELFSEYEQLGVDCVLLSSASADPVHGLMAIAHAASNWYWMSLSTTADASAGLQSAHVGPDGIDIAVASPESSELVFGEIDPAASRYEIAIQRARPWRKRARSGEIYENRVS